MGWCGSLSRRRGTTAALVHQCRCGGRDEPHASQRDGALQTDAVPSGGRVVGTEARTTVTNANDNYQVTGTVTATSTLSVTEPGLFDAVSADDRLMHSAFSAISVNSGDSIAFTFGLKSIATGARGSHPGLQQ